jgi:uncharacterized membrane protein
VSWQSYFRRYSTSFSFVGLVFAVLLFAGSLSPSLLPRPYLIQGLLSGLSTAVGYGIGVFFVWLWQYLEIPAPGAKLQFIAKRVSVVGVAIIAISFLWRAAVWQNSIRTLMEMQPVATAYPFRVAIITFFSGVILIAGGRLLGRCWNHFANKFRRLLPRRVANVLSVIVVGTLVIFLINGVLAKTALRVADAVFLRMDGLIDEGVERPTEALATGSEQSLISWDSIGRQGKDFIALGPTQEAIGEFWNQEAMRPLRVYVGLGSKDTSEERAKLALAELKRVGAFARSLLVVATPTGTGWLDPGAVDTLEYLHAGDTAIVSMQYSYLPSWITIMVDPNRSRVAARHLFNEVYSYWRTLPKDRRPKLYLHGLSLGSLGSEASAELITIFEDPINGALWSGPPFPSTTWSTITRERNSDSPAWLPKIRNGRMFRFTGEENSLDQDGAMWGPIRIVYLQHASDPMIFFSPSLLYRRPDWLIGERGPDVSPYLEWYPIVTFLQVAFDLPMATSIPIGYGHNYSPTGYMNAWIEVTDAGNWNKSDSKRLLHLLCN